MKRFVQAHMRVGEDKGPYYRPQIVGSPYSKDPKKVPPNIVKPICRAELALLGPFREMGIT